LLPLSFSIAKATLGGFGGLTTNFSDIGDGLLAFEMPPNDGSVLLSNEFFYLN
jgi:hypothetical protein